MAQTYTVQEGDTSFKIAEKLYGNGNRMNMKRFLKITGITLLSNLVAFSPCYAARIYNNTGGKITVRSTSSNGFENYSTTIAPGQRSDSVDWKHATAVGVDGANCSLDFGWRNQIRGGNYMIVNPSGCTVCDSNHKPLAKDGAAPPC